MCDGGCGCYVRRCTHAGLVAVESATDALRQCGSDAASHCLMPTEGSLEDLGKHVGKGGDVDEHHGKGDEDVACGHDRHYDAAHLGYAVDAAEDGEEGAYEEDEAHVERRDVEGLLDCSADGVAMYRVVGHTETDGAEEGKEDGKASHTVAIEHVVGRTSDEGVLIASLVELGKGTLEEGDGRTEEGDDPHPEDCSRSAYGYGCGYAGKVACAYSARKRDDECLERRYVSASAGVALGDES